MQEFVDCETPRALAEAKNLVTKAGPGHKKVFSERIQRLLFCILAKQHGFEDTLQVMLQLGEAGDLSLKSLLELWVQANRLKIWLLGLMQRLSSQGRGKEQTTKDIEQALE